MTCNNPKLDLVNMKAYINIWWKYVKEFSRYWAETKFQCKSKGLNSGTNVWKIMGNNPKVDHVNIDAHTKFI